jgi:nickel transport protein
MTSRRMILSLPALAMVLAWHGNALAHGATCRQAGGAVAVECLYDSGSPMAFCEVAVCGAASGDSVLLSGTTDAAGRFAFAPVAGGPWRVVVDDGMGHSARAEIAGADPAAPAGGEGGCASGGRPGRVCAGAAGVGVIFGIFGIYALAKSRRPGKIAKRG